MTATSGLGYTGKTVKIGAILPLGRAFGFIDRGGCLDSLNINERETTTSGAAIVTGFSLT
jgi:hypothetical protein